MGEEVTNELVELRTELRSALADQRAEILNRMFVFWAGTVLPLAGLILALNRP